MVVASLALITAVPRASAQGTPGALQINGPITGTGTLVCDGPMSLNAKFNYPSGSLTNLIVICTLNSDTAVTLGRSVLVWDVLLFSIIGLTISLGVMTVGPLVIFGFLVIPPMAALPSLGLCPRARGPRS